MKSLLASTYILIISGGVWEQNQAQEVSPLAGPLINLGAVGVCLIALAIWYIRKDARYEQDRDEDIAREREYRKEIANLQEQFRKELMEMAEKYRLALEKFGQTLDSVIHVMKRGKGGDDP